MTKEINITRKAFGLCIEGYAKQIGLRALRDAKLFAISNPEYAQSRLDQAKYLLNHAQEITRRRAA